MQKHEATSFLLSNGAHPNLKNKLGYTPLNVAIELSDYISVELLVNMGANIEQSDNFGVNYLMQAVRVGNFPIVDILLEKNIDVNSVDDNGFTALDIAYRDRKEILVKYLKKHGAKTWIRKDYAKKESIIQELERRWK
jgi:ankyrin repeat protein